MQFVEKMSNSTNVLREKNVAWQLQRLVRFLQEWLVICISWTFQDYFCFSCDVSSEMKLIPFKKWDAFQLQDRNQWTFISSETVKPMNTDKMRRCYSSLLFFSFFFLVKNNTKRKWIATVIEKFKGDIEEFPYEIGKKGNKYEIQLNDYYWWFTNTIRSKFVIRYRMTQLNFNHGRGQMRCRMDSKYTVEAI